MHVDEYRFFATRVKTLEAETASLKDILARERASFDAVAQAAKEADNARRDERVAFEVRLKDLERQIAKGNTSRWLPGIIAGGGLSSRGDVEGIIGLGWKVPIW
jgi:hypothetical protein